MASYSLRKSYFCFFASSAARTLSILPPCFAFRLFITSSLSSSCEYFSSSNSSPDIYADSSLSKSDIRLSISDSCEAKPSIASSYCITSLTALYALPISSVALSQSSELTHSSACASASAIFLEFFALRYSASRLSSSPGCIAAASISFISYSRKSRFLFLCSSSMSNSDSLCPSVLYSS